MDLSISRMELREYICRQLYNFYPDRHINGQEINKSLNLALDRTEYCFSHIKMRGYGAGNSAMFNHLHSDQYSQFLFYLSNSLWKLGGDTHICDKLILLNRALHGCWFSYKNNLPDIFLLIHPLGSILGNANYSDYLIVLQNVTVNTSRDRNGNLDLNLGRGLYLSAGSSIIGQSAVGDYCTLGVGTCLRDEKVADKNIVYRDAISNELVIKKHDNKKLLEWYFNI